MDNSLFTGLEPGPVWAHFASLCSIPRASKHEAALRRHLQAWATARGLENQVDAFGNLLIRKPAGPGGGALPVVVLQAHLDMVCQKNGASRHDFASDPIQPIFRDGWICAEETTLGADNGIGVALILAVLEDASLCHGPLEALLTVDEEAGMGGARGLTSDLLQGRLMLNLDTEDWGEFYLGCAGGVDADVRRACVAEAAPHGPAMEISLRGLRGGHSGVDIHEDRGNAIKLLVRLLNELAATQPFRLVSLNGGTARNALPREASAVIFPSAPDALEDWLRMAGADLRESLKAVDEGVELALQPVAAKAVMPRAEQDIWLASLHAAPHGVRRMSRQVPGVVETSNNLGMVDLAPDGGNCNFMVRSLVDREAMNLANEIVSLFALSGTAVELSGQYPGWAPNPDSRLLRHCQAVYRRMYGTESAVKVIHAGLECGIIGAKYPGMDIVSFGPTIRGAHAPGERVEVAAVARCWDLLREILAGVR